MMEILLERINYYFNKLFIHRNQQKSIIENHVAVVVVVLREQE